ncbi:MAG: hypothetical protein M3083_09745 [Actinomycetota bacterium]|nr:hypothetical protein [Actinomycetota bacterium]MDQ6911143.1 hypothetical protein [Actinomycetota bacterium]
MPDLLFIARADHDIPRGGAASQCPRGHEVVLDEVARLAASSTVCPGATGVSSAFVLGGRDELAWAVRNLLDNPQDPTPTPRIMIGLATLDGT